MEYYKAYEKRYQAVCDADVELWGNSEKDAILAETIRKWVEDNELRGKRVIEFACGEGSCGIILSELGVIYCGVDIAPTAVKKAKERLKRFPDARVEVIDMVKEVPQKRTVNGREVYIPLLPARARSKEGYVTELEAAGFSVEAFECSKENGAILRSADIYVRKA